MHTPTTGNGLLTAIARRLDAAEAEMWKTWHISKTDRSDELARARYVACLRRCQTLRAALLERRAA